MLRRSIVALVFAVALVPSHASADSITDFQAEISTTADRTLKIRTSTTWNGDTVDRKELVYSPESFTESECDASWTCHEGKGSNRSWRLAFQKPGGRGYILIKVISVYESTRWASIELVDHEGSRRGLADMKPGCQDLYSDGKQLIAVDSVQEGYIDPTTEPESKATAFDPVSGKVTGSPSTDDHATWKLIVKNQCGLRYFQ